VLDRNNGLYVFDVKDGSKFKRIEIGYGSNVKLEAYGDTVEVICEYHKNMFVA
jgi:hypothetical protein